MRKKVHKLATKAARQGGQTPRGQAPVDKWLIRRYRSLTGPQKQGIVYNYS